MSEWWEEIETVALTGFEKQYNPDNIKLPEPKPKVTLSPEDKAVMNIEWRLNHYGDVDEMFPQTETQETQSRTERACKAALEKTLSALRLYRNTVRPMGQDNRQS